MTRSTRTALSLLSLLVPVALARCNCDETIARLPVPNIAILDDAVPPNSHVDAEPWLVVAFGDVDPGASVTRTLAFENIGNAPLLLNKGCVVVAADLEAAKAAPCATSGGGFDFTFPADVSVRAGERVTMDITFAPRPLQGATSVFLRVDSNADAESVAAVQLTGRGTDGVLCAEPAPIHDFGDVPVGTPAPTGQITLRNCGVKPVTIATFDLAQNPDGVFSFTVLGSSPVGRTLLTDETIVLDVDFTPANAGPYRDTRAGDIRVTTAAPYAATYDLLLVGNGVVPPSCQVNVVPDTLSFIAASGATETKTVIIQSVGQCGCEVVAIGEPTPAGSGFALVPGSLPALPFVLRGTRGCDDDPAGAADAPSNITFEVSYASPVRDVAQQDNAQLVVTTTDPMEPEETVLLQANGGGAPYCQLDVTPVLPPPSFSFNITVNRWGLVEFGRTSVFVPKRLPITLKNVGNDDCTVSAVEYDLERNTLNNEFSLETEDGAPGVTSSPYEIAPGDTRTYFAVFSPTRTVDSGNSVLPSFNAGSYSGTNAAADAADLERAFICGGQFSGPNESCNGVRFVTSDTRTDVSESAQAPGVFSIGFAATPVEPQVDVIPGELDFGLVTLDCGSPTRRVTVYNNGGADLAVGQPLVDPAATPVVFRVEGTSNIGGAWPYLIPPGGSLGIEVRYFARQLGLQTANLVIPTFEGTANGPPVLVPLRGEGTTETSQTDIFDQFADPKVDVLWVVDDSGSMEPFQNLLAQNFPRFFQTSGVASADYHIAVTTTLTADGSCIGLPPSCSDDADCGAGGQCLFGLCTAGAGAANACEDDPMSGYYTTCEPSERFITPDTGNADTSFQCNVRVSNANNVNPNRPKSDNAEGGLRAAYKFLSPPNITDPAINGGFLRDDAKLHVIMVSDEPEQSKGGVEQYIDFFKNVKGFRNEGLVAVSAIAAPPEGCTYDSPDGAVQLQDDRYKAVVDELNGRFEEICTEDWTNMMSQLGLDSLGLRREFFLSRAAEDSTITVCVRSPASSPTCTPKARGAEGGATGWFYDSTTNSVVFNAGDVPARGSRVEIAYGTFCY